MENPYDDPKEFARNPWANPKCRIATKWLASLALGYIGISSLFAEFTPIGTRLLSVILMLFLAFGVQVRGRRFYLGIAIFMLVSISFQAYLMNKALATPELLATPIPPNSWLYFASSVIPHLVALISTALLCLRLSESEPAEQAVPPKSDRAGG